MHYYHIVREFLLEGMDEKTVMVKIGGVLVVGEGEQITVLRVEGQQEERRVVNVGWGVQGVVHPETYVNKVVVYNQQNVELWNVSTCRRIFSFENIIKKDAQITTIECSPIIDVVAVAYTDGSIAMLNLKTAKVIFELRQKNAVVSMSFSRNTRPLLATGDSKGAMIVWELNEKRILGKIADAHKSRIDTVIFIPGQLTILTNSVGDNSIKQWKYDEV